MCIYCGTTKYRRIYEQHNGPIPKEENGRTYEVHHIDGNHSNNEYSNLVAVTLQEHYDIHYQQEDFIACRLIAGKLGFSPEEMTTLKSKAERKKVTEGRHHLLKRKDGSSISSDLVKSGKHHLLRRQDGSSPTMDRVLNGTNPFTKIGKDHPKYLHTVYLFKHKYTGEVVKSTYYEFRSRFNLDPSNVRKIISDPNKSIHGWMCVSQV